MFSKDRYASEYFSSRNTTELSTWNAARAYRCVVVFLHCLNKMCVVHKKTALRFHSQSYFYSITVQKTKITIALIVYQIYCSSLRYGLHPNILQ